MVNYEKDIDRTEESPTMAQRDRDGHNRSLRRSKMLLGQQINIYNDTERRIHWAQRGIFVFALLATAFYVAADILNENVVLSTLSIAFCLILVVCFAFMYYKNVLFVILKRLMKEPNVVIIFVLCLCNWIIDIGKPSNSFSPMYGFVVVIINVWLKTNMFTWREINILHVVTNLS